MTDAPLGTAEEQLARARKALRAAEALAALSLFEDAISRAYYATFHGACALAAHVGLDVRTHDGLRALVYEHFIKTGALERKFGRLLARSATDRNDADYNVKVDFDGADADAAARDARDFLETVAKLVGRDE